METFTLTSPLHVDQLPRDGDNDVHRPKGHHQQQQVDSVLFNEYQQEQQQQQQQHQEEKVNLLGSQQQQGKSHLSKQFRLSESNKLIRRSLRVKHGQMVRTLSLSCLYMRERRIFPVAVDHK